MGDQSIAAIVFWLVIFGIAGLGIWSHISRERERQRTIRTAIERGQQLDPALLEKMMARPEHMDKMLERGGGSQTPEQLTVGGIITMFVGGGLALLGTFISRLEPRALWPLLGAGALVAMVGLGLLVAASVWRNMRARAMAQGPGM